MLHVHTPVVSESTALTAAARQVKSKRMAEERREELPRSAEKGSLRRVRRLLEIGVDVNAKEA